MSTSETSRVDDVGELYDEMAGMIEVLGGNITVVSRSIMQSPVRRWAAGAGG
jgi:hypothetical protein